MLEDWRIHCIEKRNELHREQRNYKHRWLVRGVAVPRFGPAQTEEFTKRVKRDPSQYSKLTHTSEWNKWRPALIAVAKIHDCQEVLDPEYAPPPGNTPEALFAEKQIYMFLVFAMMLDEIKAASFVREHHVDKDAQAVRRIPGLWDIRRIENVLTVLTKMGHITHIRKEW
jgi:hypothetical protein